MSIPKEKQRFLVLDGWNIDKQSLQHLTDDLSSGYVIRKLLPIVVEGTTTHIFMILEHNPLASGFQSVELMRLKDTRAPFAETPSYRLHKYDNLVVAGSGHDPDLPIVPILNQNTTVGIFMVIVESEPY